MAYEFAKTGDYYVSKSGNDANPGTDPNNPKLTIDSAIDAMGSGHVLIIGDGLYTELDISTPANHTLEGDSLVTIKGDNATKFFAKGGGGPTATMKNIMFIDFATDFITNTNYTFFEDCVFIGCAFKLTVNNVFSGKRCVFIDCSFDAPFKNNTTYQCLFFNCTGVGSNRIHSCFFDEATTPKFYDISTPAISNNLVMGYCIYRSSGDVDTLYSSIDAFKAAHPTLSVNSFNADPLWKADNPLDRLEFTVFENSPMIGAGLNAVNIGAVSTGNLQNYLSLEWGLSPAANTNTQFNANKALVLNGGATTGSRESKEIDLGGVQKSPFIRLNGQVDFLNNVPDSNNALTNPNALCIDVQYAGKDKVYTDWKPFRLNKKLLLDNTGKTTGEAGFDWGNTVDTFPAYYKWRPTLRNNYNVS